MAARTGKEAQPRKIPLEFASATAVVAQLESIFAPKRGRGNRTARQRVSITGDETSRLDGLGDRGKG